MITNSRRRATPWHVHHFAKHRELIRCSDICKKRHLACYSSDDIHERACTRCVRMGIPCEKLRASTANEISDLRSQVSRLSSVVADLEDEGQGSSEEANELVSKLTAFCFSPDGIQGPSKDYSGKELMRDAKDFLASNAPAADESLAQGGFIFQDGSVDASSLQELIDELPEWKEMKRILLEVPQRWCVLVDALFSPAWPRKIQGWYESAFNPSPHAHELAELFAMLALYQGVFAVMSQGVTQIMAEHKKVALRHYDMALRALESGNYLEEPTLHAVRALYMMANMDITLWVDTSRFRRGLTLLPILMSLIYDLGLNRDDFEHESPVERYERQSLATAAFRLAGWYMPALGRHTCFPLEAWSCPSPSALSEADLATDDAYETFRANLATLRGVRYRTELARLRASFEVKLHAGKLDHAGAVKLLRELRTLRDEAAVDRWEVKQRDDATWHLVYPCYLLDDIQERHARGPTLAQFQLLNLTIHHRFIFSSTPSVAAFHRAGLVSSLQYLFPIMAEGSILMGALPSLCYAAYETIVGASLLLSSASATPLPPKDAEACRLITQFYFEIRSSSGLTSTAIRLARLVTFLLERNDKPTKRMRCDAGRMPSLRRVGPAIKGEEQSFTFCSPFPSVSFDLDGVDMETRRRRLVVC